MSAYADFINLPLTEMLPLVLIAVLATIPVALPATFTLATAPGAQALVRHGVLPTRLTAYISIVQAQNITMQPAL